MNKRILLVDDERNLNQLIATNLKFEGYETESAYSGIEAIDRIRPVSPDLVVLDVMMMPGMDGFEVLEHLRHASSIPVILLTAKNRVDDRIRGLTLGADDYLGKPFANKRADRTSKLSCAAADVSPHPKNRKKQLPSLPAEMQLGSAFGKCQRY